MTNVIISPRASDDISLITERLEDDSHLKAIIFHSRFDDAIRSISMFPGIGRQRDNLTGWGKTRGVRIGPECFVETRRDEGATP